ncbi:MAG: translation initiation factor IF-2, partial [Candidatus Omnitrophota bacterium]
LFTRLNLMNVTELARKIKLTTSEMLEILPEFGFDIGRKAIKVDEKIARKILEMGDQIRLKLELNKKAKYEELKKPTVGLQPGAEVKEIQIPPVISVRDFAQVINRPVNLVIKELMKNGVMASLNQKIDFETAAILGDEFGLKLILAAGQEEVEQKQNVKDILGKESKSDLEARPPIIVVMGHVDHGKTRLLDTIRKTNVMGQEAGGITQHIGAYQAKRKDRILTFIDTPGHEAFTAMRSRGAKVADVAILVVAANDSVKPQTIEAIKIIQQAEVPLIVAINKIDLPDADIEKVKKDLASMNLIPEDWGGKTITVPISAKENIGIEDLLDTVLLVAEMEKDKIMANPNATAMGTVIESHIDKGEGPVATVLIQNGTLAVGDNLCIDDVFFGKARNLRDFNNADLAQAVPSVPVKIIGLKYAPKVGDVVCVQNVIERKNKKAKAFDIRKEETHINSKLFAAQDEDGQEVKKINVIVKADVLGSLEVIAESLEKIESQEVKVKIVSKGLGNITDSDINMALTSNALIIGFNVKATPLAADMAREKNVEIKYFNVIYHLLDDIKARMSLLLSPEVVRKDLGKAEVLAIFKTEAKNMVVGAKVREGIIAATSKIEVVRKGEVITRGTIKELQAGKQKVTEVASGQECGINFIGKPEIKINDILVAYSEEELKKII